MVLDLRRRCSHCLRRLVADQRPQPQAAVAEQAERAERIAVGTEVMTTSGLYGTVVAKQRRRHRAARRSPPASRSSGRPPRCATPTSLAAERTVRASPSDENGRESVRRRAPERRRGITSARVPSVILMHRVVSASIHLRVSAAVSNRTEEMHSPWHHPPERCASGVISWPLLAILVAAVLRRRLRFDGTRPKLGLDLVGGIRVIFTRADPEGLAAADVLADEPGAADPRGPHQQHRRHRRHRRRPGQRPARRRDPQRHRRPTSPRSARQRS